MGLILSERNMLREGLSGGHRMGNMRVDQFDGIVEICLQIRKDQRFHSRLHDLIDRKARHCNEDRQCQSTDNNYFTIIVIGKEAKHSQ